MQYVQSPSGAAVPCHPVKSGLDRIFDEIEAKAKACRSAEAEALEKVARRIDALKTYASSKREAIRSVPWFAQYSRPEWYLAAAAERLASLAVNRVYAEKLYGNRYAGDRGAFRSVSDLKSRARRGGNLQTTLLFSHAGEEIEIKEIDRLVCACGAECRNGDEFDGEAFGTYVCPSCR